jgi:hypothetical protein
MLDQAQTQKLKEFVSTYDDQGNTPLHHALFAKSPNKDDIYYMLLFGANYLAPNKVSITPLSLAIDHQDKTIFNLFIREMLNRRDIENLNKLIESNITNILKIIFSNDEGKAIVGMAFQDDKLSLLWLIAQLAIYLRRSGIDIDHQSLTCNIEERFFFCALAALFLNIKEQEDFIEAAQPLLRQIMLASEIDNIRKPILIAYENYFKWLMAKNEFEQGDGFIDAWEILNNIVELSKNMPNFSALNSIEEPLLTLLAKAVLSWPSYERQLNHLSMLNAIINKLPVTSATIYQLSYVVNSRLGLTHIAYDKLCILKKYYADTHGLYCDEELAKLRASGFDIADDSSLEQRSNNELKRKSSEAQLLTTHGLLKDRSSPLEEKDVNSFASQARSTRSS